MIHLRRTMDATFLNTVANHPDVRPMLGGKGELDLTGLVGNPANVTLVNDFGGFVCVKLDAALYEIHSLFLPEGRGAAVLAAAREGQRFIFTATDCLELVTKVPEGNDAALGLCRAGGFREAFRREQAWPREDGSLGVCRYFRLGFDEWKARDGEVACWGQRFHGAIEAAKQAAGSPLPTHPEDEAHDRAVGAAYLMAIAGNAAKAVWTYNRWAAFAAYAQISLVSAQPAILDVVDAVVQLNGEALEVLKCR